ncbi:MAG: RsmE family RNA methyltransferase [Candidatus Peribacteria bacterium]|jgi:RsmE family RNA methyltransferase|nr:RsmE family RNA methyltransferase [Candidatus Peribacteria bacterium]
MHQLFILPSLSPKGDQLSVSNVPELIGQLRKVLRLKIGDTIFLQSEEPEKEGGILRYVFKISSWTDKDLEGEILATEKIPLSLPINQDCLLLAPYKREVAMLVALPNKREKAELIVQKLSEIGVEEILFRPAERSVIKQRNEKKAERLRKISKEAVEQSRGSSLPKLGWCENLKAFCTGKKVLVFDKGGEELSYD